MDKIISLGVGKQSSALYLMSSIGLLPRADLAIFCNTGAEKTKTIDYFKYLLNWKIKNNGIPLFEASYKNLEFDLLNKNNLEITRFACIPAFTKNKDNSKGMLRRQCTGEYKINQMNKKYREILKLGNKRFPLTEIWIGISSDERHRMSIPIEKWKINVYPFCGFKIYSDGHCERMPGYVSTLGSIIKWYEDNVLLIPEKSSCKFCPFQSDYNWDRLNKLNPLDFQTACEVDESIRNMTKFGINSPLYLHKSLKPLKEIQFNKRKKGFFDDLGNCTDYCDI